MAAAASAVVIGRGALGPEAELMGAWWKRRAFSDASSKWWKVVADVGAAVGF